LNRILIDTNIYVAFKRGNERVIEMFHKVEYIGLNSVVLGELYSGFKGGSKEKSNIKDLERFLETPRVNTVVIDETTAEYYAHIFWNLKVKGTPLPTNDIWIAASAMQHGLALFSFDNHFQAIEGLLQV
jgi:predicted nucleic acid-binding protein